MDDGHEADKLSEQVSQSDLKSLVWLEWFRRQCPEVPYLLKVNDHNYVDLLSASQAIDDEEYYLDDNSIICRVRLCS